jgi:hypothetical protein
MENIVMIVIPQNGQVIQLTGFMDGQMLLYLLQPIIQEEE